jgi:hypothetical protein
MCRPCRSGRISATHSVGRATHTSVARQIEEGSFLQSGDPFKTRAEIEMKCKEYMESTRTHTHIKPLNAVHIAMRAKGPKNPNEEQHCPFELTASFSTVQREWRVNKFVPHKPMCVCQLEDKAQGSTSFTSADLARIEALRDAMREDADKKPKELQRLLKPFIHEPLNPSKCYRLKAILREELMGSELQQVQLVQATLEALHADGHYTDS